MVVQMKCKNASLGYEGGIVAERLDFEINKGDYLCILGENGSGKSTLNKSNIRTETTGQRRNRVVW